MNQSILESLNLGFYNWFIINIAHYCSLLLKKTCFTPFERSWTMLSDKAVCMCVRKFVRPYLHTHVTKCIWNKRLDLEAMIWAHKHVDTVSAPTNFNSNRQRHWPSFSRSKMWKSTLIFDTELSHKQRQIRQTMQLSTNIKLHFWLPYLHLSWPIQVVKVKRMHIANVNISETMTKH